uniref:NADH:ubiquinone oxidoreductase intermediate-associated protein 30 domain-containing protein n=2 Tax=Eutreptiella gymnastica TaxID=73025 RepID=A0A7S1NMR5_9EUGL
MSAARTWALVSVVGSAPAWRIVNDNVMGGRSMSRVEAVAEGIVFSGNIDINGGGFASCRLQLPQSLTQASGVAITARKLSGGSTRYKLLLKSKGFDVPSWQSDFMLRADGQSSTIQIPFSKFLPSFRGRVVGPPGIPADEIPELSEIGLMLSFLTDSGEPNQPGFTAGPFGILLQELLAFE